MWRRSILSLGLALASWTGTLWAQDMTEGIAGIVNTEVISWSQVRDLVQADEMQARKTLRGPDLVEKIKELRAAAIQDLINRQLMLQAFQATKRSIPDTDVWTREQELVEQTFHGNREAFEHWVDVRWNSLDRFRKDLRDELAVVQMRREAVAGAANDAEAKAREEEWLQGLRKKAYIKFP